MLRTTRSRRSTYLVLLLAASVGGATACGTTPKEDDGSATGGVSGDDEAGSSGGASSGGAASTGGAGGAGGAGSTSFADALWAFEATNEAIFLAFEHPTGDDSESGHDHYEYEATCSGGGTVQLVNDKYDTVTEIDIGTSVATFIGCVQRGLRIDGVLHDAFSRDYMQPADNTFTGTLTYGSGIGECVWDAEATADGLVFELVDGTVCDVDAVQIEAEREVFPEPF